MIQVIDYYKSKNNNKGEFPVIVPIGTILPGAEADVVAVVSSTLEKFGVMIDNAINRIKDLREKSR